MKSTLIPIVFLSLLFQQDHFIPNWSGTPLQPMAIYVENATVNDETLQVGDEIGIFDGNNCVAAALLTEEMTSLVAIFCSLDDPETPNTDGYITGNPITYKIWDASFMVEITTIDVELTEGLNYFNPYGFSFVNLNAIVIEGCTDPDAINFNPDAQVEDGSCIYEEQGCTNPWACNYNPEANTYDFSCLYLDCLGECGGSAYLDDCGLCDGNPDNDNECMGCTDPIALNYNPDVEIDDGDCEYPEMGDGNSDFQIDILDLVFTVALIMDYYQGEFLFWMDLNFDENINILDIIMLVEWIMNPELVGCTNPFAVNYNQPAIYDNGTCVYIFEPELLYVNAGNYFHSYTGEIHSIEYDYEIMKYEVTNSQYLEYLELASELGLVWYENGMYMGYYSGDEEYPPGEYRFNEFPDIEWVNDSFYLAGMFNHPVRNVSFMGAAAMAEFYGLRLPTTDEWNKAAMGWIISDYPWGENVGDDISDNANYLYFGDPFSTSSPVGFYNGQQYDGFQTTDSPSLYGLYDLSGNVWEWTDSDFVGEENRRRIKGGCWHVDPDQLQSWNGATLNPTIPHYYTGFRLVRDP